MFAGAAREAVFSNPDVIRRVHADFVPVALKAGLVNNPTDDEEGRLYREIGRSKIAPQGICVVNSAGKVLDWALMFDDDKSVLAFLDHTKKRFGQYPDAKKSFPAERYMKFPSQKLADVEDSGEVPVVVDHHPEGKSCPATPRVQEGTMIACLFGRALDKDGKLVADTVRQEHYVEDRFHVPVAMQEALAKALADAGTERFPLADDLARLLVSHAFLGQLDVNPLAEARDGKGALKHCEFWAQKVEGGGNDPVRVRIEGKSEAAGGTSDAGRGGDGAFWRHEVKLTWEGIIKLEGKHMSRLLLVARGSEKLKWGNKHQGLKDQADVTILPGGHAIDLSCGVRYGILGEPVAADQVGDAEVPAPGPQPNPAEAGRQLTETLGPPFLVFRDKVQKELKLSDEQKQKLQKRLQGMVQDAMQFFQKLGDKEPEEREKELQAYRQRVQENLTAFLQGLLQEEQLKRLRQVMLQRDRLFALLGDAEVAKELEITGKQRQQFGEVAREMQKKIEPLLKEAQKGGNPVEIGLKIRKIHKEQEQKIEALLTDPQKKKWKELLGKPLDLSDGGQRSRLEPATPESSFGPANGLIALTLRDRHGRLQIFTIHPDGTGKKQLTTEGDNGRPDWSPDGRKIAFNSIRGGKKHTIWVMNADGTDQRFLSEGLTPTWSPDGNKIAYAFGQIYVMDADGSHKRQITKGDTHKAGPSWSPDGKQMVFILLKNPGSKTGFHPVIGIINADGTKERILTTEERTNIKVNPGGKPTVLGTARDANAPSWSPVGNTIAYWSGIEGAYGQVWTMKADGTGSKQLTAAPKGTNNDDPAWSPDGKWILFGTNRGGKNELWVMDADGNNQRRISDMDAFPFPGRASWQPRVSKK